ncbi:translation initiation factor IF-2-like [Panicum virgatum]|uniref:translation initiation factor IF-2-like n=1 Tax=Panicum virgatum TaxID=38727 RepID=UPI0019D629DD|nr:translation initiation factor IF-2-like [Panicum virgatum]
MLGTECTNKIVPQNSPQFKTKDLDHPNPIERTGTLGFNALKRTDSPTRARRARSSSPRPAFETFSDRHPTAPRPPAPPQARPVLGGSVAAAGPPACLLRRLGPKPPPAPPHAGSHPAGLPPARPPGGALSGRGASCAASRRPHPAELPPARRPGGAPSGRGASCAACASSAASDRAASCAASGRGRRRTGRLLRRLRTASGWAGSVRLAAGGVGVRHARRASCPACGQSFLAPFLKSEHLGSFWLV